MAGRKDSASTRSAPTAFGAGDIPSRLRSRFERDLSRLLPEKSRIGVAVSGGPDSLALLLLSASARPGEVEAATVDHGLRVESAAEAGAVAELCASGKIPHAILPVTVRPGASVQARAREARYAALGRWAIERGLVAVLTAHHADDQAETLLMRLARGSGLAGLSSVRPVNRQSDVTIARPLLGWRKAELLAVVAAAGIEPRHDPSNDDPRHDRTRARAFLESQAWLDPERLAASAGYLGEAEEALAFAAQSVFEQRRTRASDALLLEAAGLPAELQRRLLLLAFGELGAPPPRGPDLARALEMLAAEKSCTLAGLKLIGGRRWRVEPAPLRR